MKEGVCFLIEENLSIEKCVQYFIKYVRIVVELVGRKYFRFDF